MIFRNKKEIEDQIKNYKDALQNAKSIEKDLKWLKLYEDRLETLNEIIGYLNSENSNKLDSILTEEGRSYGWSFYPGDHGEKAENAFWELKKLLTG